MGYFDPHLRQMWVMHHGRQPPHQRDDDDHSDGQETSQASAQPGTDAAGPAAAPAGPSDEPSRGSHSAAQGAGGATETGRTSGSGQQGGSTGSGYDPTSSVIYGMLRSGFSWEQLRGNCFQMFFAGGSDSAGTSCCQSAMQSLSV